MTMNGQDLLDRRKVQSFFDSLASVRISEVIDDQVVKEKQLETFFTTSGSHLEKIRFVFENSTIEFFLGRKLEFDQSFYVKVVHDGVAKYVIAYDSSPLSQTVRKDVYHRSDIKYRRFQSLFYLDKSFFFDYRIFSKWMSEKWSLKKVDFHSQRQRSFTFSFSDLKLNPRSPSFLELNMEKLKLFEKSLSSFGG